MASPARRLVASGAAYQAAGLAAGVLALVTLPLYTRALSAPELGWAEVLLTWIILLSILLRAGLQEALLRHWAVDEDPRRRARLARTVVGAVLAASTVAALAVVAAAEPLARLVLAADEPAVVRAAAVGVWAFTNLEVAYALLRAREARRRYLVASLTNVVLTVALTVTLVVALDGGAVGYLLGNHVASAVVLLGLWLAEPGLRRLPPGPDAPTAADRPPAARRGLRGLLAFGLPVVPAEATVFALNLVDRQVLLHVSGAAAAGVFAAAVKLATLVIVAARAFQAAWPPLAYALPAAQAGIVGARVVRGYVVVVGLVVVALLLLREPLVALLVGPRFADAAGPLPWLALGWGLYGLTWVFTTIAGRADATGRTLPAALAGLAANVLALVLLVPPLGATGAAIALVVAYVVLLAVARARTRRLADLPLERGRLVRAVLVLAGGGVTCDLLLPGGVEPVAILLRVAAIAVVAAATVAAGAVRPAELRAVGGALTSRGRRRAGTGDDAG